MNHTSKMALQLFAMILVGAVFFMGGCGAENLDDPTYLYQGDEGLSSNDAADKTDAQTRPMMAQGRMMGEGRTEDAGQPMAEGMGMPQGNPGMQVGAGAGPAVAVAAAPVIQLPDAYVELPPEFRANPPIVTESAESNGYSQTILHSRDIHVAQPAVNNHLVTTNHHRHDVFQEHIINHPTFTNNVAFAATFSESNEVLPTTEVTAPLVVTPGFVGPGPGFGFGGGFGGGFGCGGWWSGGLGRCRAPLGGPLGP